MLKVYEGHHGATHPDDKAEMRKHIEYLMENSVSFSIHDDRGGTGCFTIVVPFEETGEQWPSQMHVPPKDAKRRRWLKVRRWLTRHRYIKRDAAAQIPV